MPDMTAMELEATALPTPVSSRAVDHVLRFVTGALFTAALVAGGAVLVTLALTAGVVVAPVLAVALLVVAVRVSRPSYRTGRSAS